MRDWPAHSGYLPAPTMDGRFILVEGARQNNLKTVGVRVPVGAVTAVTGVAGAGKSSLAFEVLHAEGYRRYVETFSPYARQFLERLDRPAADRIEGVLPSLAIDRTAPVRTSRSTVGTMTSIADYLRALWARAAVLHCKSCGQVVARDSPSSIFNALIAAAEGKQVLLCFPCRVGRVSAKALRETLQETGFRRVLENGSPVVLEEAELRAHDGVVTVVLDRIGVERDRRQRIIDSLESALRYGKGRVELHIDGHEEPLRFSEALHCARCDLGYSDPTPALFSFNNPVGACETCKGFGRTMEIDPDLVVPDPRLSIAQGCVKPFQTPFYGDCQQDLLRFLKRQRLRADAPWGDLPQETRRLIWEGEPGGRKQWRTRWYGIGGFFEWLESKTYRMHVRVLLSRYRRYSPCPDCRGARLKPAALLFRIEGKTLPDAESMFIADAERFFSAFKPNANDTASDLLLREIRGRLRFLCDVGLGYLTLSRQSRTLSGGEAQRVTLATALGSSLTSTLYVLDEPSIGLHPRDAGRLAGVLRRLAAAGNAVVVVEHDPALIGSADHVIDLGPGPGKQGGEVVYQGPLPGLLEAPRSQTGAFLAGRLEMPAPKERRRPDPGRKLRAVRARENNLRDLTVDVPLGLFVCVTGVSGSGKSTLVDQVLYRNLRRQLGLPESEAGACDALQGAGLLEGAVLVDQSPLGRARERGDIHGGARSASPGLRRHRGRARPRAAALGVLVQLRCRRLPALPRGRIREGRAAVPPRRLHPLPRLRRPPLPPRSAGGALPRLQHRRAARPARGGGGEGLRGRRARPQGSAAAARHRPRLPLAVAASANPLGRRGAAAEARLPPGAGQRCAQPPAGARRADHRTAPERRVEARRRAAPAGRRGEFRRGGRARHAAGEVGGLDRGPRARGGR